MTIYQDSTSSYQVERAKRLTIMALTVRDGYTLTVRGVQEAFGVARCTALRDLNALNEIVPVIRSRKGQEYTWDKA